MRQTLDNAGAPLATASYDPWGTPQGSAISPFGFTGELQDAQGLTYLRARWYTPGTGTLLGVDPFEGFPEQPYTQHPYAYAIGDPIRYTDPSGRCFTGAVVDTVICWSVVGGIITLAAGGVVANDPAARSAADDFGRRSAIALQHMGADAARGARFISSGEWWPDQEFFPLPPQEGKPLRLGPDLGEYCSSLPEGFSQEQLDPSWWLRPGPALNDETPRTHTGTPIEGEQPNVVMQAISMEEALELAVQHVGPNAVMEVSGSGGIQFRGQPYRDSTGRIITRIARLDINPASRHVQSMGGPHLNLEVQVNGVRQPAVDPHIPIDPSTIRPNDY